MEAVKPSSLPFKISVLIFIRNQEGKELLLRRNKTPNRGCWSPIGGKLEMSLGESPAECALRETKEEIGVSLREEDIHLFCMISEKGYEGCGHWLMFLYKSKVRLSALPEEIGEGCFSFFSRREIERLPIPETDREALWPLYDKYGERFVALRADCAPGAPLNIVIEEIH